MLNLSLEHALLQLDWGNFLQLLRVAHYLPDMGKLLSAFLLLCKFETSVALLNTHTFQPYTDVLAELPLHSFQVLATFF